MDRLASDTAGQRIQWMTGLGCTETAPFALSGRPGVWQDRRVPEHHAALVEQLYWDPPPADILCIG